MLEPTKWYKVTRELTHSQPGYTEGARKVRIEKGVYVVRGSGQERLIEHTIVMSNQFDTVISKTVERWNIKRPLGPPVSYWKDTYSNAHLPGFNVGRRTAKKVEREEAEFHAFTPWAHFQDEQAATRLISGVLVFDTRTTSVTTEEKADLEDGGLNPEGDADLVVHSVRSWREGVNRGSTLTQSDATQRAKWVDYHTSIEDLVDQQADGWYITTITKGFRASEVEFDGPRFIKRQDFRYDLPVPIDPCVLEATAGDGEVTLTATGGGATLDGGNVTGDRRVMPTSYKFYRRTSSEPDRTAGTDPHGWWDTPPAAEGAYRSVVGDDSITDLSGSPISGLPGQSSYTVPEDEAEPDSEDTWRLLGEVDNGEQFLETGDGRGVFDDEDVMTGASYEYYAVAVVQTEESDRSNVEYVSYAGAESTHSTLVSTRRKDDGSLVVDIVAPDDPNLLDVDYGDPLFFDVPAMLDLDLSDYLGAGPPGPTHDVATTDIQTVGQLAAAVGSRWMTRERRPKLTATLTLLAPLLGLERLQRIIIDQIAWEALAPGHVIASHVEGDTWLVRGYREKWSRGTDGALSVEGTVLDLESK